MITDETRLDSFIKRPASKRQQMILDVLGNEEMSARMIAQKLGFSDLNAVKPRLTELKSKGVIYASGKGYDLLTKRYVALYRRAGQ